MANGVLANGDNHGRTPTGSLKFGPLEESLREPISQLLNASDAIQTITQVLEKFKTEVAYVNQNYQRDLEKDRTITELNVSLRNVTLVRTEEAGKLKAEVKRLTTEKTSCDRKREEYEKMKKEFESKIAANEAWLYEQLSLKEKALGKDYKEKEVALQGELKQDLEKAKKENLKKLKELKDERDTALEKVKSLEDQVKFEKKNVEAERKKLKIKKERHTAQREGLESQNSKLRAELDQLKGDFAVQALPLEDCSKRFQNLAKDILRVATSYSEKLPESAGKPEAAEELRERLTELDPVFQWTPISPNPDSKALRISDIEHVIQKHIHQMVWQPFSSDIVSNSENARTLLCRVSDQLSGMSENVESTWRALTLRGLDKLDSRSSDNLVDAVVNKVLRTLKPLLDPASLDTQEGMLSKIVRDAVGLWRDIQRDRHKVEIDTKPNREDKAGWISAYGTELPQDGHPSDEAGLEHITLFPQVRRIGTDANSQKVLIPGRAIFSDSPTLARGIAERNEIRDEIDTEKMEQVAEAARKQLQEAIQRIDSTRKRGHSRNASAASPISPSAGFGSVDTGIAA
ncbi:hypothetical protein FGG08_006493 [Glutinoglossum americanum]|uniref:Uncharacterized protein n=1 Tax=Glutinoglossum americanum TaxID=1670608 RepID=A0A9P8I790_9PEZI|nr:hypothetical protein FGG08_006493 [Glutinoglossum americanum]